MLVAASEFIPDDPQYAQAWHLPKVQAPLAWEMATAEGVTIAILDSGVDTSHPDLADQIVAGWNSVSGNTDTADINGHGTKVAGTAAATTNNTIGVAAIGWNANIMPVRITNRSEGYAYWSDIANGLTWAADHGADVADTTAPTVDINNPVDDSTVGRTVAINVAGWDNVNVATIKLYIDGRLKSSSSSASLDYSWNTRKVASGAHTILAEAVDTSGNLTSRSIQVNIGSGSVSGGGSKGKGKKK